MLVIFLSFLFTPLPFPCLIGIMNRLLTKQKVIRKENNNKNNISNKNNNKEIVELIKISSVRNKLRFSSRCVTRSYENLRKRMRNYTTPYCFSKYSLTKRTKILTRPNKNFSIRRSKDCEEM